MQKKLAFIIAAAVSASFLSSCDDQGPEVAPQASCPAGAALITVTDGYLEAICGCAEPAPAYYPSGTRLLCTVTAGTTVFFNYLGTHARHQIIPTGTPAIPPSPLSNPEDQAMMVRAHAVKLETTGTYGFNDAFDNSLAGDLVVL